ncbi:hypothetical protein AgCh_024174 [Apium graveolens]
MSKRGLPELPFTYTDSKGVGCSKKKKKKKNKDVKKNAPSLCSAAASSSSNSNKVHNEINAQDTHTSQTTAHAINTTASFSTTFANKLKLLDTRDESFCFQDDVDDGDYDPSFSEELDREVEDFARRLKTKPPVIYFDSSSQELDLLQVHLKEKDPR